MQRFSDGADGLALTNDDVLKSVGFVSTDGHDIEQIFDENGDLDKTIDHTTGVVTDYTHDAARHKYTVASGSTVQHFKDGADGEWLTNDDVLESVDFEGTDGHLMSHIFNAIGQLLKVIDQTAGKTVTEYVYDEANHKYKVISGTTVQNFEDGADNEELSEDDILESV